MFTIYVYVLDTLADWELGHAVAELHSGRFFKKGAPPISLKTVSLTKVPSSYARPAVTWGPYVACV